MVYVGIGQDRALYGAVTEAFPGLQDIILVDLLAQIG